MDVGTLQRDTLLLEHHGENFWGSYNGSWYVATVSYVVETFFCHKNVENHNVNEWYGPDIDNSSLYLLGQRQLSAIHFIFYHLAKAYWKWAVF